MHLKRLHLKNIKQHEDVEHNFVDAGGNIARLIGVIGPNGSGKSGILDGMSWLWTGEVPELNKDELISWPGDAKEAYYEAEYDVEGEPLKLRRDATSTFASMDFRGKKFKTVTAVNNEIRDQLRIDKELCQNSMFVRQKHIDDILFTEPAERRKAWQRLMGLGKSDEIHTAMGNYLSALPTPVDFEHEMESGLQHLRSYRAAMHKLASELGPPVDPAEIKLCDEQLAAYSELQGRFRELGLLQTERHALQTELPGIERTVVSLQQTVAGCTGGEVVDAAALTQDIARRTQHVNAIRNSMAAFAELERVARNLEDTQTAYQSAVDANAVESGAVRLDELRKEYDDGMKAVTTVNGEAGLYRQLLKPLKACKAGPKCPLCRQDVPNSEGLITELEGRISDMEAKAAAASATMTPILMKLNATVERRRNLETTMTRSASQIQQLIAQRDSLVLKITAPVDQEKLDEESRDLQDRQELMSSFLVKQAALKKQELLLATHVQVLAQKRERLAEVNRRLTFFAGLDASTDLSAPTELLQTRRRRLLELQQERGRKLGEWKGLRRAASSSVDNVKGIRVQMASEKRRMDAVRSLEIVRSFFHYSKGPHLVVSRLLDDITGGVNDMLQYFSAPFIVQPDFESLEFRVIYLDGRKVRPEPPTARKILSGGEKMVLALSFRLASYYMFAARTGFMSLDEPTVYLDETNVENFGQLLEKLKKLMMETDLQIMISTHERTIMKNLDYVIDLQKPTIT